MAKALQTTACKVIFVIGILGTLFLYYYTIHFKNSFATYFQETEHKNQTTSIGSSNFTTFKTTNLPNNKSSTTHLPQSTSTYFTLALTTLPQIKSTPTTLNSISSLAPTTKLMTPKLTTVELSNDLLLCPFPKIDPFDPAIKSHITKHKPLTCDGKPSLAYVEDNILKINKQKVKTKVGSVEFCKYTELKLASANDMTLLPPKWSKKFLNTTKIPDNLEHLYVQCINKGKVVGETYKSRIIEKQEVEKRSEKRYADHLKEHSPAETLSVMFIGVDGMSKQNLIRTMPKTRDFLLKSMQAKELNMFNKVGDNTFQNVIVLLSGKTHTYFENIKGWNMKKDYFDKLDDMFIWNKYQKAGYRTAILFDMVKGTAFHYLKMGWKQPPFDYYHRPGPLMMDKNSKKDPDENCIGDQREISLLLDYYLELTAKFNNTKKKPYFAYSFFTHLTHDYFNDASKGDEMFYEFFSTLHKNKVLNNTVLVFFSDHGLRFGAMRRTFHGFIEGRSPYFFFVFPPWFEKKYQKEMSNLETNQNRLTTFFDVHATLYDLLYLRGKRGNDNEKILGRSLFQEIPKTRTCEEAHIPDEYCLCKGVSKKKMSEKLKNELADIFLGMINDRTKNNRNICSLLSLKSIKSVFEFSSGKSTNDYYQMTIQTTPGGGYFEALLDYKTSSKTASLVGDIIRLNFYKGQDGCVSTLALKPYCYCKE